MAPDEYDSSALGCDLSGGNGHFLRALVEAAVLEAGLLKALENANQIRVLLTLCLASGLSSGPWARSQKVRS